MKKSSKTGYWFKRRRYGWGWVPVTWQGWLTVFVFAVGIIGIGFVADRNQGVDYLELWVIVAEVVLASGLALACYKRGPKPKWRWGKSSDDNPQEDW